MLPVDVLNEAASELTDWRSSGMSVIEVSHRGADFVECAADAEATLRRVMGIPDGYRVLFLQGGASAQFAAIPMNLTAPGDAVSYLNTGQWSKKAIAEAGNFDLQVTVAADEKASGYTRVPDEGSYEVDPASAYLHYTPNETIGGVEFGYVPHVEGVPIIADMSSTILSRPIDVEKFGVIYGGAQKNMGPSGLCVLVVREDLLGRARPITPTILNWAKQAAADSMLNTPPTFSVYLLGKILHWIEDTGGLTQMGQRNQAKATALYSYIDNSAFYANPVAPEARSWMNVPFTLAEAELDKAFLAGATEAGLANLKGHRSVGGMRASIYNAMPMDGVEALISYMRSFETDHA